MAASVRCSVCFDTGEHESGTGWLAVQPCGHVFHEACLLQSLEYRKACPNCRVSTASLLLLTAATGGTTPASCLRLPPVSHRCRSDLALPLLSPLRCLAELFIAGCDLFHLAMACCIKAQPAFGVCSDVIVMNAASRRRKTQKQVAGLPGPL